MKPRNADETRRRLLAAAQRAFSTHGFSAAKVRDIALEAAVNPALVNRYFGSKLGLFRAALEDVLDARPITGGARADLGARLARLFLSTPGESNPLPMIMFAAADPEAQAVAQRLLDDRVLRPVAGWLGEPEAEARAARLMAVATGFYAYRLLYPLPAFAGIPGAGTHAWLERALQAAVDGD